MEIHRLTLADEWFIQKGQVDSISRSHFSLGDEVVVCDRQHVMLAEFYDGECPTCHSKMLVKFTRENVEPGTLHTFVGACPKCNKNVTIIFSQHGKQPYIGKCPGCNKKIILEPNYFENIKVFQKAERYIQNVKKVLASILLLAIAIIMFLNYKGLISNEELLVYWREVAIPRTVNIVDSFKEYVVSASINVQFEKSFIAISKNTSIIVNNSRDVFMILLVGLQFVLLTIWNGTLGVYENTCKMLELIKVKTELLIRYFER